VNLILLKKSHLHLPTALCKCANPKVSLNEIQRAQQVSKESPLPRLMSLLTLKHAQNVRISSKPKSAASSPWTQVCCTTQILRFRGVLMPDSAEQSQYHSKDACVKRGWNLKFQQRLLVSARYGIPQIFTNYTLECGLHCEVTIETPKC